MTAGAVTEVKAHKNIDDWLESIDLDSPVVLGCDELERAYFEAASVLSSFSPETLQPAHWQGDDLKPASFYLTENSDPDQEVENCSYVYKLSEAVEPIVHNSDDSRWAMLASSRRDVLAQLGSRAAMQKALDANPERPSDGLQWAFETIVNQNKYDKYKLSRDRISGLIQVSTWLKDIIDDLPDSEELSRLLERNAIREIFEKLAGPHFSGRRDELLKLEDYVGIIESKSFGQAMTRGTSEIAYHFFDRPPFVIHGPGGVGKSALLAKFILNHFEASENSIPFAYLNFDRYRLRAAQPLTLIIDTAWQLGVQYPAFAESFDQFSQTCGEILARQDNVEQSKGFYDWEEWLLPKFNDILMSAVPDESPFLMVLDTFEEVQFMGEATVDVVWEFLSRLQSAVPRLRPVVAGRARIRKRLLTAELELEDFDSESARAVLRHIFVELKIEHDDEIINQVVSTIGGNPLSLWLAARFVKQQGVKKLKSLRTRNLWLVKLKAEQIQAILHGRILQHLHDEGLTKQDIAKIAYPGLLVRRITPQIIWHVLAGPCNLRINDEDHALELFNKLSQEVALVENAPDDPEPLVLRHRENVRRVMLDDLARIKPKVAKLIHHKAINFYKDQEGKVARAEELYHRLKLGQSAATIKKYWPGDLNLDSLLAPALDELGPKGRVILAEQLGISLDAKSLREADQEGWEHATERRVNTYLQSGNFDKAIEVLRERKDKDRLPGSKLYLLEANVLRSLGDLRSARVVANKGLASLSEAPNIILTVHLLLMLALVDEEESELASALENAEHALHLVSVDGDPIDSLRAQTAVVRLLRKMSVQTPDEKVNSRHQQMLEKLKVDAKANARKLPDHPALYREIVAEIGNVDPKFLKAGIKSLGVEVQDEREVTKLAKELKNWSNTLLRKDKRHQKENVRSVAEIFKIDIEGGKATSKSWNEWVRNNAGSRLSSQLLRLLDTVQDKKPMQKILTQQFRSAVDSSINRPNTRRGKKFNL